MLVNDGDLENLMKFSDQLELCDRKDSIFANISAEEGSLDSIAIQLSEPFNNWASNDPFDFDNILLSKISDNEGLTVPDIYSSVIYFRGNS